jgi:hypothetical protein
MVSKNMRASKKLKLQNQCANQKKLSIRHFEDWFTSQEVKWLGSEADHSPPSSAK